MKILIFTEGTILMHKNAADHIREEIVKQVKEKELSVKDYSSYIPVGNSPEKLTKWKKQGAEILYLTSRKKQQEVEYIRKVLRKYNFPSGELLFRKEGEEYKDIAEKIVPNVFIEDDCKSIGENEITTNHVKPEIRKKIKSILIKEFGGIDHLPENIQKLSNWAGFFIIIRGPLGCGKSTIAHKISKIIGAEYIPIDRILDEHNLTKDYEQGYISQKSFLKANTIIMLTAKKKLRQGIPVVFDGNFYWKSQIEDLIRRLDFPHHIFTLKAPLKVCIERDSKRKKSHGKDAAQAVYKKAVEFDYGIVIDNSGSAKKTVAQIISQIEE